MERYTDKISRENYIQEWFSGSGYEITLDEAVDSIIEAYPLSGDVTKTDVVEWVKSEVVSFNSQCEGEHHLPLV